MRQRSTPFLRGILRGRHLIAVAVTASLAVPAVASATISAERTGSFAASGTGTVVVNGSFTDAFGSKLRGTLIVRDPKGDAKVLIGGVAQKAKRITIGTKVVRMFTIRRPNRAFSFYVKGSNVRITIKSPDNPLSLQVFGRGTVTRLDGDGTFTLNDDAPVAWADAALPLRIKPPKPTRTASITTPPVEAAA